MKRTVSAATGRSDSLKISLTTSAIGWSRPFGPTRYGPVALLDERRHLALGVDHHGRREQQHDEDGEDDAELGDVQWNHQ